MGVNPLVEALRNALSLSQEERKKMGERGRLLIQSKYAWQKTTEKLLQVYDAILSKKTIPSSFS